MPHDSRSVELRVGDVVRGKGYNLKDEKGNLREFTGIVHEINPASSVCNIQVLVVEPLDAGDVVKDATHYYLTSVSILGGKFYRTIVEYGQCDHFVKVN